MRAREAMREQRLRPLRYRAAMRPELHVLLGGDSGLQRRRLRLQRQLLRAQSAMHRQRLRRLQEPIGMRRCL